MWQSVWGDKVSGWDNLHRVKFPTHMSPALSTHFCLAKSPAHSSKNVKGFQRKEKSPHVKVCVAALSRGTTTELKCQGPWRVSPYGSWGGGRWWSPLAKSGLYLERGSKIGGDLCVEQPPEEAPEKSASEPPKCPQGELWSVGRTGFALLLARTEFHGPLNPRRHVLAEVGW